MIDPAQDSDSTLISRAAAGEQEAARELIDLTGSTVYGFVFARVGGHQVVAEDVVQATYLEAVRSAHNFRGDSTITTWLCAIARHQISRHYKSERRRTRLEGRLRLVLDESPTEELSEEDAIADADSVISALGQLPPLHRQVLVMKYLDEFSVEEIANELKRSKVQIQSLLQRARGRLRRLLEDISNE